MHLPLKEPWATKAKLRSVEWAIVQSRWHVFPLLLILFGCQEPKQAASPNNSPVDPLLGKWVSDGQANIDGVTTLDFMPGGRVDMQLKQEKPAHLFFQREPIAEWDKRRDAEIAKSHPEIAKKINEFGADITSVFGKDTEVISMSEDARGASPTGMPLMFSPSRKSLMFPLAIAFVRPGQEKRYSQRKDKGDGSRAPFHFLEDQTPIFADSATGDWAYTWKTDWRGLLITADKELRGRGFEEPGSATEPQALAGKTGSVIFYAGADSENVSLSPDLRSEWKGGKWVTSPKSGWVTVHVNIKVRKDGQPTH